MSSRMTSSSLPHAERRALLMGSGAVFVAAASSAKSAVPAGSPTAPVIQTEASAETAEQLTISRRDKGAIARSVQARLDDAMYVNDFGAIGDGVTDNTTAINAAVLALAVRGGGQLSFGTAPSPYLVTGPILVPGHTMFNLNGQTLAGHSGVVGTMFETAAVVDGRLVSNLGSSPETQSVYGSAVTNGRIINCSRAFHMRNFNLGCAIIGIETSSCLQFGLFERCFYMKLENCSNRGMNNGDRFAFHFRDETNNVSLSRVSATKDMGFLFENGGAAVSMHACSFEGGSIGVKIIGDLIGLNIQSCYFEAITGTVFDLSDVRIIFWSLASNYFNYTNCIVDDGGTGKAQIYGVWEASNAIVNVGRYVGGRSYPAEMRISSENHYCVYRHHDSAAEPAVPSNWKISPATRFEIEGIYGGTSLTDVVSRSRFYGGVVPHIYAGNTGAGYPGRVPYSEVSFSRGRSATLTLTSQMTWQPATLLAALRLTLVDDEGSHKIYGTVYGDEFKQDDLSGKRVALRESGGMLQLIVEDVRNASGQAQVTGTLRMIG
jgi:hypothetical protein